MRESKESGFILIVTALNRFGVLMTFTVISSTRTPFCGHEGGMRDLNDGGLIRRCVILHAAFGSRVVVDIRGVGEWVVCQVRLVDQLDDLGIPHMNQVIEASDP